MIAWWWVLVAVVVPWLLLFIVAVRVGGLREEFVTVVLTVVAFPLLVVMGVLRRHDTGLVRLSPGKLVELAQSRSADGRPVYAFFVRHRGIIVVRKWAVGDERVHVSVRRGDEVGS